MARSGAEVTVDECNEVAGLGVGLTEVAKEPTKRPRIEVREVPAQPVFDEGAPRAGKIAVEIDPELRLIFERLLKIATCRRQGVRDFGRRKPRLHRNLGVGLAVAVAVI